MERRQRAEAGETLIELMMTITIMGIVVIGMLSAISTAVITADVNRKQSAAGTIVRSYADAVLRATYVNCTPPSPTFTPPAGYTVSITSTQYWDGSTAPAAFTGSCSSDLGLQSITVRAASTDNRGAETLTIYKRKPCDPTNTC